MKYKKLLFLLAAPLILSACHDSQDSSPKFTLKVQMVNNTHTWHLGETRDVKINIDIEQDNRDLTLKAAKNHNYATFDLKKEFVDKMLKDLNKQIPQGSQGGTFLQQGKNVIGKCTNHIKVNWDGIGQGNCTLQVTYGIPIVKRLGADQIPAIQCWSKDDANYQRTYICQDGSCKYNRYDSNTASLKCALSYDKKIK